MSHHKWHFNKLEATHAINHMKDATNITLHILKVSRHINSCGIQKTIVLHKDMLNRQMYYVLKTGRHVTLAGIMYKLIRTAHAI